MCPSGSTALAPESRPRPHAGFSLLFPPEPGWVRAARDAVRTALAPAHADCKPELADTAVLLTSEVVTNAVNACRHTGCSSPIALHAEWATGGVRVHVHDHAPGAPRLDPPRRRAPDEQPENGNGMLLVSAFATDWGICRHGPGTGKTVWFTLADGV
ncbi:ATP-binding protein [Streptomyces caatingaensis]|uniref:DNA-directed RNA polymerase II n=1 Tax=Streptomyces caatingaensis TaxID=1678637 RepID=A0A0K9XE53_9ACTN|nr:ATP-binding protein [Streptomyces caatingaensis]KNB51391.1 DNA-directed RNA polymerase II [Streptomyces caatingaensis]